MNEYIVTVDLYRDGLNSPWGFRLKGGTDVDGGTPLEIIRVRYVILMYINMVLAVRLEAKKTFHIDLSRRLVMKTCHKDLLQRHVAKTCHKDLSQRLVTKTCCKDLLQRLVAKTCC